MFPFWPRPPRRTDLRRIAHALNELKELTVATAAELNAKIDTLTGSVDAAKQRIAEDFQALRDQLDQVLAGDNPELDAAVAKLDESIASLDSVDPDPSNPAAPEA